MTLQQVAKPVDIVWEVESRQVNGTMEMDTENDKEREPLIVNWNLWNFQADINKSLINIFRRTRSSRLRPFNYKPLFTVINCDVHKRRDKLRMKHRHRVEFPQFLEILEGLGARTVFLASSDSAQGIPILFESGDGELNYDVVKQWKRIEKENRRPPRDIFSELFIAEILKSGQIPDLNNFRVGPSDFHRYDANSFLSGKLRWENLRKL